MNPIRRKAFATPPHALAAAFLAVSLAVMAGCASPSNTGLHGAPAIAKTLENPGGEAADAAAGRRLYAAQCASCHGAQGEGVSYFPPLAKGATQTASAGEVFWFITHGNEKANMPAWDKLPETQRWQIVAFLKSGAMAQNADPPPVAQTGGKILAPPPAPPFTDFRYQAPGVSHRIVPADLPAPYASGSSTNGPKLVPRPASAWPKAPPGFKVELFATDLENPRQIRIAPNGDVFIAETRGGRIRLFRGLGADGKPQQTQVFATGLNRPFGLAFYPNGAQPQWLYVGDTDAVLRIAYRNGDLTARGAPERLAELPTGGHSTRDIRFSPDGKRMFVSVGSKSNVDDDAGETHRANILSYAPDGSDMQVYASGIRNPVGLAIDPETGDLWCSTNERDGLGDNLVPDYITHVRQGGFYGWPWWYIGAHQDPRHAGKHPELADRVIVPDVLLQPHNASLGLVFYDGAQFPAEYRGDIFAAEHGSWNRAVRTGYEVIRLPRHGTARASGEYEDFLTGFVLEDGNVWGRPVGVTVAPDGSLLVSDDGSNSIWRVSYAKP